MNVPTLAPAVALAAMLAVPALAQDTGSTLGNEVAPMATTSPEIMIYRVAGVTNTNDTVVESVATSFMCYNNSSVT